MNTTKRVKKVYITPELVAEVLTEGYDLCRHVRCTAGLPKGAKLKATFLDHQHGLALLFEHASFPESDMGAEAPVAEIKFEILEKIDE